MSEITLGTTRILVEKNIKNELFWKAYWTYKDSNGKQRQISIALELTFIHKNKKYVPKKDKDGNLIIPSFKDAKKTNYKKAKEEAEKKRKDAEKRLEDKLKNPQKEDECDMVFVIDKYKTEKYKVWRPNSIKTCEKQLELIRPYFVNHRVLANSFNQETMDDYLNHEIDNGRKNLLKKYERIKLILNYGHRRGFVKNYPYLPSENKPKNNTRPVIPIDMDQYEVFLEASRCTRYETAVMLFGHTGMRPEEATALNWNEVDLQSKKIRILRIVNTNGTEENAVKRDYSYRQIEISPELYEYFVQLKDKQKSIKNLLGSSYQDHNLVCCEKDGGIMNPHDLSNGLPKISKKIQKTDPSFPHIFPYVLRHSFNEWLAEDGVELTRRAYILGHTDQMNLRYLEHSGTAANKSLKEFQKRRSNRKNENQN